MNKKLIGIHGKPHSGKDTIANFLIPLLNLKRFGPSVQVKKATAAMFNIPEEYLYDEKMKDQIDSFWGISYREMAQKVGNESSRKIFGEDFWMRHVNKYLETIPNYLDGIVLADIRYANEAAWVKDNGGVMIFVNRGDRPIASNESHEAERGLDSGLANIVIENNGTIDALYEKVSIFINNVYNLTPVTPKGGYLQNTMEVYCGIGSDGNL